MCVCVCVCVRARARAPAPAYAWARTCVYFLGILNVLERVLKGALCPCYLENCAMQHIFVVVIIISITTTMKPTSRALFFRHTQT